MTLSYKLYQFLSIRVLIYAKAAVPNYHGPLNSDKFSMCKSDCQWVSVLVPTWRIGGTASALRHGAGVAGALLV